MSMKYRIRDTETDSLMTPSDYFLDHSGGVFSFNGFIHYPELIAELEVADGVYEGDYLLTDIFGSQHILEIKSSFEAVEVRTGMILEVNLCHKEHYEVIKCR